MVITQLFIIDLNILNLFFISSLTWYPSPLESRLANLSKVFSNSFSNAKTEGLIWDCPAYKTRY